MDHLPDRTSCRKRDAHSVASSPSPPPSRCIARTAANSEEPTNKRVRREEASRDTTADRHHGHTYSQGVARDRAQVQYGDRHNHVYNYNGCPSQSCDGHGSLQEEEQGRPDDFAQALETLAFARMEERRDTISKSYSNTCEWLFQQQEYLNWRDTAKMSEHFGFFWIKSKPGAGKSTLMKFFLKSAKEQLPDDNVISFFFNARGEALEKSLEGLYRSLIHQLMTQIPRLQHHLRVAGDSTSQYQTWSLESLKAIFAEAVMHLEQDRLTCLIDALDECPEVEIREMIESFEELGELAADKRIELRICFSSRYYPHVTMNKCQDMLLDRQAGHEEDITKYVKSKLKTRKGKTGEELRQAVQAKAQGVFMWVVLVVRILNKESDRGSNNASLRKCLDQIPSELHKLFEDILQRGIRDDENLVPILQWVSFSQRPLACEELYFALRSDRPDFHVAKPWDQDEDDTETMRLFILNSSKGLAELTRGKKPTVQFIHESVRDYLRDTGFRILSPDLHNSLLGSTHDYLKRCCHRWMTEEIIEKLALPEELPKARSREAKELRDKAATYFPFLEYAVNNLIQHAELACSYGIPQANFMETFPQAQWTVINNLLAIYDTRRHEGLRIPRLCIFTSKGALRIVEERLKQGWSPSHHHLVEASRAAVKSGNIQALWLMLGTFAQSALTNDDLYYLVDLSIDKHNATALRIILSHLPHHNPAGEFLRRAYRTMKLDLVQELLAWPGLGTNDQWHALATSILLLKPDNDSDLARFLSNELRALLENVAEANSMIDELVSLVGRWPSMLSNRYVVKILIETEFTSNSVSHRRRSAMVSACAQGFRTLVHDLFDQGYRIGLMDGASYFDALSGASRNGHAATLEILLAHEPDIELQEADSYREVVQAVTMGRYGEVLKLLLDRSKGFRAQDKAIYRGPLRQAAQLGFHDIVQILRERGVTLPEDGATGLELPGSVAQPPTTGWSPWSLV